MHTAPRRTAPHRAMHTAAVIFEIICLAHGSEPDRADIDKRINDFTRARNVSDDRIIIAELDTFVNDNGLRRKTDNVARMPPKYFHPSEKQLNLKVLDMMRQSLYATQGRMGAMDSLLSRFKNDPALRMAFIFNRLKQLIIDIRRVYTLALKWYSKKRVWEQIVWYAHCTRKYVDVLYVVQYLVEVHTQHATMRGEDEPSP